MKKLRPAMAAGDITTLRREAHSLKGACGYIASDRLLGSQALQFTCDALLAGNTPKTPLESCFQSAITDFGFVCEAIPGITALRSCEGVRDSRGAALPTCNLQRNWQPRRSRRPSA